LFELTEDYCHSHAFLDGEVFRNVGLYHTLSDFSESGMWLDRFPTDSKRDDFNRVQNLITYDPFRCAMNALLRFRGLWCGWLQGVLRRIFRMKCPESHAAYLQNMYNVYSTIMEGIDGELLDEDTVKSLEGRSPVWSTADRVYIEDLFQTGKVFWRVTDRNTRTQLKHAVLSINTVIPSFATYLHNTKFLEPAALVLRRLLPNRFSGTMVQQMRRHFVSKTTDLTEQEAEFSRAYRSVWLVALRLFPYLTKMKPLLDFRMQEQEYKEDPRRWSLMAKSALNYGFKTREISQLVSDCPPDAAMQTDNPKLTVNSIHQWNLKRRCGMPSVAMFRQITPYLSFEHIYAIRTMEPGLELTSFAVARDTIRAFFLQEEQPRLGIQETQSQLATDTAMSESPKEVTRQSTTIPRRTSIQLAAPLTISIPEVTGTPLLNGPPTPFPPIIATNSQLSPISVSDRNSPIEIQPNDRWDREVLRQNIASRARSAFLTCMSLKDVYCSIYVYYDDQGGSKLYHPTEEQLGLLNECFLHSRRDWWFATYEGELLGAISPKDVADKLKEERFVICGYDEFAFHQAQKGERPAAC
jgi:hypothetical protein